MKGSKNTHLERVTPRDLVEKTLKELERERESISLMWERERERERKKRGWVGDEWWGLWMNENELAQEEKQMSWGEEG
jgi:hypothetical protein